MTVSTGKVRESFNAEYARGARVKRRPPECTEGEGCWVLAGTAATVSPAPGRSRCVACGGQIGYLPSDVKGRLGKRRG